MPNIDQLKAETIADLNQRLIRLSKQNPPATEKNIKKEVTDCFEKAFDQVKSEKQKLELWRAVSLATHPDKVARNWNNDVIQMLVALNLKEYPNVILNVFKEKSLAIRRLERIREHVKYIVIFKRALFNELNSELINRYTPILEAQKGILREISPAADIFFKMEDNLNRYVTPLKQIFNFVHELWFYAITDVVTAIDQLVFIALFIARGLLKLLTDFVTSGIYSAKCGEFVKQNYEDEQDAYILKLKIIDGLEQMDNKDYLNAYLDTAADQDHRKVFASQQERSDYLCDKYIVKPTKEEIYKKITGRLALKFLASSIYLVLTTLPDGAFNKFLAIVAYLPRLILALPLLVSVAAVEITAELLSFVVAASKVVGGLLITPILFVLNIPMFVWDSPSYIYTAVINAPSYIYNALKNAPSYIASALKNIFGSKPSNDASSTKLMLTDGQLGSAGFNPNGDDDEAGFEGGSGYNNPQTVTPPAPSSQPPKADVDPNAKPEAKGSDQTPASDSSFSM